MIDLHMHSNYSDGSLTPAELLEMAEEKNLKLISITDHNRIDAYSDLKDPAVRGRFTGKIISGTECSTTINGQAVELLCYGAEPELLQDYLEENYRVKQKNTPSELEVLYTSYKERGIRLDLPMSAYSKEKYTSPRRFIFALLRANEENKKYFLDPANMNDVPPFYRKELFNEKSPLFVDYSCFFPKPDELIKVLHDAGGKVFLAHCYLYTEAITDHLLEIAQRYKLDGIECYYTSFNPEQTAYLVDLCKANKLLISGGSDFHGAIRPQVQMGALSTDPQNFNWTIKIAGR